ncbi:hypothetical protein BDZ94DRAFT_1241003 [Collybia nuda]|uniref:DUF6533 domain-containing protein n=1 Tax=Collybia nuda TaxID=64659 RepID=A0A9P5XWT2_9AGAR|nr:hypothetical protein BDZ94DRAFT_1241003 [Collybia nuda]
MPDSTNFTQLNIQYASIVNPRAFTLVVALIYYDYALTFGWEVQYIWGGKFRPSTLFYVCARYSLFVNVLFLVSIIDKNSPQPYNTAVMWGTRSVVPSAYWAAPVWTARTYVVYDSNKLILAYFSTLGLACIALDIVDVPSASCKDTSNMASTLVAGLMCLFELSTALCTGVRTFQSLMVDDPTLAPRKGLLRLLLEQGLFLIPIPNFYIPSQGGFFQRLLNALTLP